MCLKTVNLVSLPIVADDPPKDAAHISHIARLVATKNQ